MNFSRELVMFIFVLFLTLVLTSFLVLYLIKHLVLKKLLDQPGPRKVHAHGITRLGGEVLFFVSLLVVSIFQQELFGMVLLLAAALTILFLGVVEYI